MDSFATATAVTPLGDGHYTCDLPASWLTGKGCFGGAVLGALLRAIEASEPERAQRRTRALAGEVLAPVVPGAAAIDVAILRRGAGLSFLEARLSQAGKLAARASASLGVARLGDPPVLPPAHDFPPGAAWSDVPVAPVVTPPAPIFTQHYEYRVTGGLPFSGAATNLTGGWVRERGTPTAIDAPAVVGLCDSWWPTLAVAERRPRYSSTINFGMQLFVDPADLPPGEPLRYLAHAPAFHDGYFLEVRELWSASLGRRVAANQQTFVLLG